MPVPPFAQGRPWHKRASKAYRSVDRRVYHDQENDYEYERCFSGKDTWHEIDWHRRQYRDVDRVTGHPIAGYEGQWRPLR